MLLVIDGTGWQDGRCCCHGDHSRGVVVVVVLPMSQSKGKVVVVTMVRLAHDVSRC